MASHPPLPEGVFYLASRRSCSSIRGTWERTPVSRKIVAFKLREGRAETLLDVTPGPHEVRVEVTWDQGRRASTKVVDVASGSTGLLEVRGGRVTKDLSPSWSRLAKD